MEDNLIIRCRKFYLSLKQHYDTILQEESIDNIIKILFNDLHISSNVYVSSYITSRSNKCILYEGYIDYDNSIYDISGSINCNNANDDIYKLLEKLTTAYYTIISNNDISTDVLMNLVRFGGN